MCWASTLPPELTRLAKKAAGQANFPVESSITRPRNTLEKDSIDTAVTIWSVCSLPDPVKALQERRVLKPDGLLIFVEHGRAPEPKVVAWQDRLTPLWKRCAGGSHLNRKIDDMVQQGGFDIADLSTGYSQGTAADGLHVRRRCQGLLSSAHEGAAGDGAESLRRPATV